jgi:hypothetical protein
MENTDGEIKFKFHALGYDYQTASTLMLQSNLPASYANTLLTGIWDNCEIMPEEETKQQGLPLQF